MQKFSEKSGFTLVEMITTMTILSILAVFSVKPMGEFVGRARQAEAKNSLSHISAAQTHYAIAKSKYQTIASYGGGQGTCTCTSPCTGTHTDSQTCTAAGGTWDSSNQCNGGDWLNLQGCIHMRYHYEIHGDSEGHYAIAKTEGDNLVFGCSVNSSGARPYSSIANPAVNGVGTRYGSTAITLPSGTEDVHFITEEQGLTTAFDAVANCE